MSQTDAKTESQLSLLDEPLFLVRDRDDERLEMTLPEIYVALADDEILSFESLQPHQQQPWFSFLVQVAAMALGEGATDELSSDTQTWRELLVGLAEGSENAWCMVVEDVSEPAFLQPPVPEGSLDEAGYKADTPYPDALDVLITTKTHDIKRNRITSPRAEHWVFALLTLQTMEGYFGVGNYGIVRMNGGYGNRPFVGLGSGLTWGARFDRDVRVLRESVERIARHGDYDLEGRRLLWLASWDGGKNSGIPLADCHPYFVEMCRRIRFGDHAGELKCWRTNTDGKRISAPDDLSGQTGDPWTPIDKSAGKALTLGGGGFTYRVLQQLWLTDDYDRPPAMEFQDFDPERGYLIATTLVRGQGKTEGWHRRIVPIPFEVKQLFAGGADERMKLAKRARKRVALASDVQSKVLRAPTLTLVYGDREPSQPDWDKVNPWIEEFDRSVDERFFDALWDSIIDGLDEQQAEAQWHRILKDLAVDLYEDIRESVPLPSIHRYRVLSRADGQFYARLHDVLGYAFDHEDSANEGTNERLATQ